MWVKCWDVLGMAWPPRARVKALERGSDSPLLLVCTGVKGKGYPLSSTRHEIRSVAKPFRGHRGNNMDCSH